MMGFGGGPVFRKVAIIGVGLIGGSLGKAIKKHQLAREVIGFSRRRETLAAAVQAQAIDHGSLDLKKAVLNADLVVLATPVRAVEEIMRQIEPDLKKGVLVMDVGSTKAGIVASAQAVLSNGAMFVGAHPLAGSEKRGIEFADENLFAGSTCILTPVETTNRGAVERVKRLWASVGAAVKIMDPEEHDRTLAYVSHLPHVIAYALMQTIPSEFLPYGATGLKDTTRIAASSPEVWQDICLVNSRNMLDAMDAFVEHFSTMRRAMGESDDKVLLEQFQAAQKKREGLA